MMMSKIERFEKVKELLEMKDIFGPNGNNTRFEILYKKVFKKEPPITFDRSYADYKDKIIIAILDGIEIPDEVPDNVDI